MGRAGCNTHRRPDADPLEPISSRHSDANTELDKAAASAMLCEKIRAMYARFEEYHRLPAGMGQKLLLQTGMTLRMR